MGNEKRQGKYRDNNRGVCVLREDVRKKLSKIQKKTRRNEYS